MKTPYYAIISILSLLCACKGAPKSVPTADSTTVTDTTTVTQPKTEPEGTPVNYSNTKVLEKVYVTHANGADTKQGPIAASATISNRTYGTQLDVIEVNKDWLGVLEYVNRKTPTGYTTRWEKVYVEKRLTGAITDIKLAAKDLNVINSLNHNDKTETYPNGKILTNYLEIELIDKALFDEKKSTAAEFMLRDTNAITKVKGVLTLPCTQKNKVYKDKPAEEENREEYNYYGQIEALNKYVVNGSYYESWDCKLVDKTTGKETAIGDIPFVAPDMKNMICISDNPYDQTSDFEIYSINNTQLKHVVSLSFSQWVPRIEKENMFWSSDGYLYIPVVHSSIYWNSNENLNYDSQYIRIKIKS